MTLRMQQPASRFWLELDGECELHSSTSRLPLGVLEHRGHAWVAIDYTRNTELGPFRTPLEAQLALEAQWNPR